MKYKIKVRKNPMTKAKKYYAASTSPSVVNLSQIAARIEDVSSLSRGDIMNVLDNLQRITVDEISRGNSVRLGLLGAFRTSISSKGSDKAEDVKVEHIRRVGVVFTPSSEMKHKLLPSALTFEKDEEKKPAQPKP